MHDSKYIRQDGEIMRPWLGETWKNPSASRLGARQKQRKTMKRMAYLWEVFISYPIGPLYTEITRPCWVGDISALDQHPFDQCSVFWCIEGHSWGRSGIGSSSPTVLLRGDFKKSVRISINNTKTKNNTTTRTNRFGDKCQYNCCAILLHWVLTQYLIMTKKKIIDIKFKPCTKPAPQF